MNALLQIFLSQAKFHLCLGIPDHAEIIIFLRAGVKSGLTILVRENYGDLNQFRYGMKKVN